MQKLTAQRPIPVSSPKNATRMQKLDSSILIKKMLVGDLLIANKGQFNNLGFQAHPGATCSENPSNTITNLSSMISCLEFF